MTAGLPGIGLGGVFVVLCALVTPIASLFRRGVGRSARALFVLAFVSAVAGSAALAITFKVAGLKILATQIVSFGAPVVVFSTLVLVLVLLVPEIQYRVSGTRSTATPRPVQRLQGGPVGGQASSQRGGSAVHRLASAPMPSTHDRTS
jgi:hypothetical protein